MHKYHKITSLFTRKLTDRITIVDNHWSHYALIQQIEAGTAVKPFPASITIKVTAIQDLYYNFPSPLTNKICKVFEFNGPTFFLPLKNNNVDIQPYKKNDVLDTQTQAAPDQRFDFSKSIYQDKRIHGMDNKAYDNPREFQSKIFSQLSVEKYDGGLWALENLIINSDLNLSLERLNAIHKALMKMSTTSHDIVQHQLAWAENLHIFPDKYIPPLRVPKNFSTEDLRIFYVILLKALKICKHL